MVSHTREALFSFRPLHTWPVWRWPACVRSVSGRLVTSAAIWLVLPCVSRLIFGSFAAGSLSLQPVLAHPVVVHVLGFGPFSVTMWLSSRMWCSV